MLLIGFSKYSFEIYFKYILSHAIDALHPSSTAYTAHFYRALQHIPADICEVQ